MIDFEMAIEIATKNAKALLPDAKNFVLEGVLLSNDNSLYEVTLSYDLQGKSPLELGAGSAPSSIGQLATLLSRRREYKTFLVDWALGQFKGFKNYKDR